MINNLEWLFPSKTQDLNVPETSPKTKPYIDCAICVLLIKFELEITVFVVELKNWIKECPKLLKMFKNYRPIAFFSVLTAIVAFIALGFLTPTFIEFFTTGTFNWTIWTLFGGFFSVSSLQLLMTGIVLNTIASKERRDFELSLQEVSARRGKNND